MMTPRTLLPALLCLAACAVQPLRADVSLPALMSGNMVLQQGAPVHIWGWAAEGEQVTVTFRGQQVSTTTSNGLWMVTLAPTTAGGPFTMTVEGDNSIELHNILVGEVWVSCGQSNMMMSLNSTDGGPEAAAMSTNYPLVRLFNVTGDARATNVPPDITGTWKESTPSTVGGFSAVSYFFGRALTRDLAVPVGLINVVAIVPAEAWVDADALHADRVLEVLFDHALKVASKSYMGLIAPIQRYSIKGAIYYQGEYNAGRGHQFRTLFPALIRSWRATWGQGDFPFLFVQLPSFYEHRAADDPVLDMPDPPAGSASAWSELREAQLRTWQSVTNTGMATAIDVGEAWDIHPRNKEPVGERLALSARALAYDEALVHSGPVLDTVEQHGESLVLRYQHVGGGLAPTGRALDGFAVAGADQQYVFASAVVSGDTVVVSAPGITTPIHVRYAWANYPWEFYPVGERPIPPTNSLYNVEGLPAVPFRAHVQGMAFQVDTFDVSFGNPSFEDQQADAGASNAAAWVESAGARRMDATTSHGGWSMHLPKAAKITQDGMVAAAVHRYDWNSDLLDEARFRPGTLTGYSADMASADGTERKMYMNLCCNSSASGYQYWGGIPNFYTASQTFVTRHAVHLMRDIFNLPGTATSVGGRYIDQSATAGDVIMDNFSALHVVRPTLAISDTSMIRFGTLLTNTVATAPARQISNGQAATLPGKLTDNDATNHVASVLYGVCDITNTMNWGFQHAFGVTDHVGAEIIGPAAQRFEFVSSHTGSTARALRLIGPDETAGLHGGPAPEQEPLTVRFLGSPTAAVHQATVRIVTQAGNVGTLSSGLDTEPLEHLYYVDIPLWARTTLPGVAPEGTRLLAK